MRLWLVGLAVSIAVIALLIGIGVAFLLEQKSMLVSSPAAAAPGKGGGAQNKSGFPNVAPAEPSNPVLSEFPSTDRRYTWAEAEHALDRLRLMRKTNPVADEVLGSWYTFLSEPSFTDSPTEAQHLVELERLAAEHPQSAALLVVLAKTHLKSGWQARGSLGNEDVSAERLTALREKAAAAKELLTKALDLGVQDAQAHALLIDVARIEGASLAETRALFDAGRTLDSRLLDLYIAMAEYLLPRWHGQPGDIERFAAEMVKAMPGDDGLDVYIHIAYAMNQYDPNLLFWGDYDRGLLTKGAQLIARRYAHTRNLLPFAALCTIAAQDHAAARSLRPLIKHNDAPRVWLWQFVSAEYYRWAESPEIEAGKCTWVWGAPLNFPPLVFSREAQSVWCPSGLGSLAAVQWDVTKQVPLAAFASGGSRITHLAADARQSRLVAAVALGKGPRLLAWNTAEPDGQPLEHALSGDCVALAVHPTEPLVTYAVDDRVALLDLATKRGRALYEADARVQDLHLSGDGNSLAISASSFTVCDAASGEKQYILPGPQQAVGGDFACEKILDFDAEGRLWALGFVPGSNPVQRRVVRFESDGSAPFTILESFLPSWSLQPLSAVLSPDRRQIAIVTQPRRAEETEQIAIVDLSTGQHQLLAGHTEHIGDLAFSPDGRRLATVNQAGGALRLWNLVPVGGGTKR